MPVAVDANHRLPLRLVLVTDRHATRPRPRDVVRASLDAGLLAVQPDKDLAARTFFALAERRAR
jgi:hypothetical protein